MGFGLLVVGDPRALFWSSIFRAIAVLSRPACSKVFLSLLSLKNSPALYFSPLLVLVIFQYWYYFLSFHCKTFLCSSAWLPIPSISLSNFHIFIARSELVTLIFLNCFQGSEPIFWALVFCVSWMQSLSCTFSVFPKLFTAFLFFEKVTYLRLHFLCFCNFMSFSTVQSILAKYRLGRRQLHQLSLQFPQFLFVYFPSHPYMLVFNYFDSAWSVLPPTSSSPCNKPNCLSSGAIALSMFTWGLQLLHIFSFRILLFHPFFLNVYVVPQCRQNMIFHLFSTAWVACTFSAFCPCLFSVWLISLLHSSFATAFIFSCLFNREPVFCILSSLLAFTTLTYFVLFIPVRTALTILFGMKVYFWTIFGSILFLYATLRTLITPFFFPRSSLPSDVIWHSNTLQMAK